MKNIILEFLEVYKSLDELCKQILLSDIGISKYISEMENESQGRMKVACWEADYKKLKKMRWIRNQLVHEMNSFQDNLINAEDIEWLKNFYSRIIESKDPFSLLYQSRNTTGKITKQEKAPEDYHRTNQPPYQPSYQPPYQPSHQPSYNNNRNLLVGGIILIGILILIIIIYLSLKM